MWTPTVYKRLEQLDIFGAGIEMLGRDHATARELYKTRKI
jgi:hypothetical protein